MRFGGTPRRADGDSLQASSLQESRVMCVLCGCVDECVTHNSMCKNSHHARVYRSKHPSELNELYAPSIWMESISSVRADKGVGPSSILSKVCPAAKHCSKSLYQMMCTSLTCRLILTCPVLPVRGPTPMFIMQDKEGVTGLYCMYTPRYPVIIRIPLSSIRIPREVYSIGSHCQSNYDFFLLHNNPKTSFALMKPSPSLLLFKKLSVALLLHRQQSSALWWFCGRASKMCILDDSGQNVFTHYINV